jgi:hypothetical protein
VDVVVRAEDANGVTDAAYRGTVSFGSTDPLASLPMNYTFTTADQGIHRFATSTVLRTLGDQSISVDDSFNGLHGSWSVTVYPDLQAIPMTGAGGRALLVVMLAVAGAWLLARASP